MVKIRPKAFLLGPVFHKTAKPLLDGLFGMARWWNTYGTEVPFSDEDHAFTLSSEQFWGRAARASETFMVRTLVIFGGFLGRLSWLDKAKKAVLIAPPFSISEDWTYLVEIVKTTEIGICVSVCCCLKRHCLTASCAASARMAGPPSTCRF